MDQQYPLEYYSERPVGRISADLNSAYETCARVVLDGNFASIFGVA
jgi:hypothetical protein